MRVVLAVAGTRGDVMPFAALASRLIRHGHEVTMVTHRELACHLPPGVTPAWADSSPHALISGPAGSALRRGSLQALNRTRRHFADFVHSLARPTSKALIDADVLVASTFAIAAVDEAIRVEVPVVRAHLWPEFPGTGGPMPLVPYSWVLPDPARQTARRSLRRLETYLGGVDGSWRLGRLTLRSTHPVGLTTATAGTVHAYSPSVSPSVSPDVAVTGWWVAPEEHALSEETARFLARPGRVAYCGFGSMHQPAPDALLATIQEACERNGMRAVVQLPGVSGLCAPDVLGLDEEPHETLFRRMSVVVHHGGAGGTRAAVRAGVPSVVIPHFADQYFWAHRLATVGVAPPPLARHRLSARRLARRLAQAAEPSMATQAGDLARRVLREDGTGHAVNYLEGLMAPRGESTYCHG